MEPAGFLTQHMAAHIVAMNVVAPLAVLSWRLMAGAGRGAAGARWIWPAAATQMALLWLWHLPAPMAFAFAEPSALAAMHLSLFAAALWFWRAVLHETEEARWRAIGALLFSGKLFCLLGVLLTFAPRALYLRAAELCLGSSASAEALLPDQQLAGLIMLAACPLTYIVAGVVIAARWLNDIEARTPSHLPEGNG